MHREPVRCVCFDWGGVILRHCRSWEEACQVAGIPLREGAMDPDVVRLRRELHHQYSTGRVTCADFFSRLTELQRGLYTEHEIRTLHQRWITREYDGVAAIIERLNALPHIETALLSNTCQAHWERHLPNARGQADFPTIGLLRHKHASHLLGFVKPDEAIYRAFEDATGYLASEILFFDDLAENVRAARDRGWRAEPIDHTCETAPQIAALLTAHGVW
jgi:glucose-1-phosphatase